MADQSTGKHISSRHLTLQPYKNLPPEVTRSPSKPPPSVSAPVITSTLSPAYSPQSGKGNQDRFPKYSNVRTYYDDHDIHRTCHQLVDKQTHTPALAQADICYADQSQSTSHVSTGNRKTTSQHGGLQSGRPASALNTFVNPIIATDTNFVNSINPNTMVGGTYAHMHGRPELPVSGPLHSVTAGSTGDPYYGSHPHHARSTGDRAHRYLRTGASTGDELVCPTTKDVGPTPPRSQGDTHHELPEFMQNIHYPHCETVSSPPHRSAWSDEGVVVFETPGGSKLDSIPPSPTSAPPFASWPFPTYMLPAEAARLYDVTRSASSVNHEGSVHTDRLGGEPMGHPGYRPLRQQLDLRCHTLRLSHTILRPPEDGP